MSIKRTETELNDHKNAVISEIDAYLTGLIASNNPDVISKSSKLSYWLSDYIKFLRAESHFVPSALRRYKRGEIIKVHLGYNIGSEEGGLHYCVVLDVDNGLYNPVITIIPLTSLKSHHDTTKLRGGEIYLGNELFTNLNSKISSYQRSIASDIKGLEDALKELSVDTPSYKIQIDAIMEKLACVKKDDKLIERMKKEVLKMKIGSIALVNQITTVSKMRIYDPKNNHDVLSNVRLSNEKLDLIDKEIIKNYTKSKV